MRIVVAIGVVLVAAACGAGHPRFAVSRDGRAVLQDAYDGKLDRSWSCGSLRAAYRRLPQDPPAYSTIPALIGAAAGRACDAALASVHAGDSQRKVTASLGTPDRKPRCWMYEWPPGSGSIDGARVCFTAARVARIQTAVHG